MNLFSPIEEKKVTLPDLWRSVGALHDWLLDDFPEAVRGEEAMRFLAEQRLEAHRRAIAKEWAHSPHNQFKRQTYKQFLFECLRSIGITKRTLEESRFEAVARYPKIYSWK